MIQAKQLHVKGYGLRLNCDSAPRSTSSFGLNWWKLGLLGLGMYLAWVLARGVWDIRLAYRRIDEAREVLALEQAKAEKLREKWEDVQTREYLETVARNDLNMQKEGETVVVLAGSNQRAAGGSQQLEEKDGKTEKEAPNYLKWWNLVR